MGTTAELDALLFVDDIFGIRFIITAACFAFRSSELASEPLRLRLDGDDLSADSSELRFEERFLLLPL